VKTRVSDPDAIRIRGQAVGRKGITERRLMGCGFVPEERHGHAAVPDMPLTANLVLSRHASDQFGCSCREVRSGLDQHRRSRRGGSTHLSKAMDVRKSGDDPTAGSLSGGNLQKFIVGRELDRQPVVLVVNQPTWGVDAGAASRIRQALIDLAKSGSAVVVISQDLDEVFEIAGRIAVINEGRLSEPEPAATMTRERIGLLMGGFHDGTGHAHAEAIHAH
jgi:ABC-type uncharacterized transport system ATPase subunit